MRSATLKDVAEFCGTSPSTVSRALAGNPKISEQTRARIEDAARQLHYRPNRQAQALKGSGTQTIGLIVPGVGNQYFANLADSIQSCAAAEGLSLIMASSNDDPERLVESLDIMLNQRIDGAIVVPHIGTEEALLKVESDGTPIVLVDRKLTWEDSADVGEMSFVDSDPTEGIRAAVKLLASGGRKVGYLAGPSDTSTGVGRRAAFCTACEGLGVPYLIYDGGYEERQGFEGAGVLFEQGCSAILAGDSMMTVGVLRRCLAEGLDIGEDILLVGFDDFPVFELQNTPITIIDQNVERMGQEAFSLLMGKITQVREGLRPKQTFKSLPTELIVRASTGMEVKK